MNIVSLKKFYTRSGGGSVFNPAIIPGFYAGYVFPGNIIKGAFTDRCYGVHEATGNTDLDLLQSATLQTTASRMPKLTFDTTIGKEVMTIDGTEFSGQQSMYTINKFIPQPHAVAVVMKMNSDTNGKIFIQNGGYSMYTSIEGDGVNRLKTQSAGFGGSTNQYVVGQWCIIFAEIKLSKSYVMVNRLQRSSNETLTSVSNGTSLYIGGDANGAAPQASYAEVWFYNNWSTTDYILKPYWEAFYNRINTLYSLKV